MGYCPHTFPAEMITCHNLRSPSMSALPKKRRISRDTLPPPCLLLTPQGKWLRNDSPVPCLLPCSLDRIAGTGLPHPLGRGVKMGRDLFSHLSDGRFEPCFPSLLDRVADTASSHLTMKVRTTQIPTEGTRAPSSGSSQQGFIPRGERLPFRPRG